MFEKKIFGEDLAAFQARRGGIRTENWQPGFFKDIHHAGAKRRFRADNRQVRLFLERPRHEAVEIGGGEGKIDSNLSRTRIARCGKKLNLGIILAQPPGDRVFASARTDQKNFHGDFRT